jgi:hypothetical protein
MSPMAARRLAAEDERRLDDDEDDDEAYRQRTPRKLHMPDLEAGAGKSSIAPGADAAAEEANSAAIAQLQAEIQQLKSSAAELHTENTQLKSSLQQLEAARAADADRAAGVLSLVVAERDRLRAAAADASALTQQVRTTPVSCTLGQSGLRSACGLELCAKSI